MRPSGPGSVAGAPPDTVLQHAPVLDDARYNTIVIEEFFRAAAAMPMRPSRAPAAGLEEWRRGPVGGRRRPPHDPGAIPERAPLSMPRVTIQVRRQNFTRTCNDGNS